MKMKHFALLSACGFILFSAGAEANINLKFKAPLSILKGVQCDQIQGRWVGEGTIQSICKYKGSATITSAGNPGQYTVNVDLQHDSWYFWCPDPHAMTLPATCSGNTLDISTSNGTHLSGDTDGHSATLAGEIVLGDGVKVSLDSLHLTKE